MIQPHIALDFRRRNGVGRIRLLRRAIHDVEHALRAGQRREDRADLHGQRVDGLRELAGIVDEHGQTADVELAQRAQYAAHAGGDGIADLAGVAHDGAHDAAPEHRADLLVAHIVVEHIELLDAGALVVEHLDDLLAVDGLLDVAVDSAQRRLLRRIVLVARRADPAAQLHEQRHEHHRDERQPNVGVEHHGERADQRHRAGNDAQQAVIQHGADVVHVVGEAAHDLAVVLGVVKAHRQRLQLVEQVVAQLLNRALRHLDDQPALEIRAGDADQIGRAQQRQHAAQIGDAHRRAQAGIGHVVDDRAHDVGGGHVRHRADHKADKRQYQPHAVGHDIAHQPPDDRACVLGLFDAAQAAAPRAAGAGTAGASRSAGAARAAGLGHAVVSLLQILKASLCHQASSSFRLI